MRIWNHINPQTPPTVTTIAIIEVMDVEDVTTTVAEGEVDITMIGTMKTSTSQRSLSSAVIKTDIMHPHVLTDFYSYKRLPRQITTTTPILTHRKLKN